MPDTQQPDSPENAESPSPRSASRIALIAAPGRMLPFPARPAQLYSASEFFTLALAAARRIPGRVYILSPRYGLLRPDGPPVRPYKSDPPDLWPPARRHAWADQIVAALLPHLRPGDTCIFYAGRAYRSEIQYKLAQLGYSGEAPLQGLDPEAQLARLRILAGEAPDGR